VLAAAMSDGELQEMLDELGEIRLANGQPVPREELLAELDRVRKQGYAVSLGERMLGIVAVAAPVVDTHGATIAAVSVAGTADRLTSKEIDWLSIEVRDAAKMIAERYDGGSRNG
jgi:IclR family acetate operon transcriptional repressor